MELKRESKTGLNIAAEAEVLTFTYTGQLPIQAVARVDLGSTGGFLSGVGGLYIASAYIGGTEIVPIGEIVVPPGKTKCIVVSKHIPLSTGDTLSLRVQGQSADTLVNTVATLQDATPLRTSDLYGGGPIQVDHDYGSTDALAYRLATGEGVVGADIVVYTRTDYDNGSRGHANVVARTMTGAAGRWARALMLTPGNYTLILFKAGQAGPDRHDITIA